ncbi:putative diphthamide synthesis protein-domain-containing protein [Globomyces pollinis-pini]|nr:putative diphthamide synthesis protein-domain-containing protein [Globomyces pollinis-pini]
MKLKECNQEATECCGSNKGCTEPVEVKAKSETPRKRFVGRKSKTSGNSNALVTSASKIVKSIPDDILQNQQLIEAIKVLPGNYNFEIFKSVWQIKKNNSKRVALQFPEGLLMFSLAIADILERFCNVETLIMGDVTYGACCIDDFTARGINCDFMIHYGHSCLVPVDVTSIKTLYVFVDIGIDVSHFVGTVRKNIEKGKKIALVSTVQFISSLQVAVNDLSTDYELYVPQCRPLSKGEILGCTAPKLNGQELLIYLGDGRFHLEAIMIANPGVSSYRYDPYSKKFTRELYDHKEMYALREEAISIAKTGKKYGLILGTLGRQGSSKVMDHIEKQLKERNIEYVRILLSEILPDKLSLFNDIDVFIQIACPRLSIDWGYSYPKPLLTPYEAAVVFEQIPKWSTVGDGTYPMDFYAKDSLGPWTPNHDPNIKVKPVRS